MNDFKKATLLFLAVVLLGLIIPIAIALTPPTNGVLYYNFSNYTDLWDNYNGINNGATSDTSYPSFNTTGNSSPSSSYFNSYYVDTGYTHNLIDDHTFNFWIKTTQTSEFRLGVYDGTGYNYFFRGSRSASGGMTTGVYDGTNVWQVDTATGLGWNDGNWHMITVTTGQEYTDSTIWLDGIEQLTTASATGTINSHVLSKSIWFGGINDKGVLDDQLYGYLDEIQIFDKHLNDTEVLLLYNYGYSESPQDENFTITAVDFFGDAVLNFTVVIDGTDTYNTTIGTITTNIYDNDSSLHNFIIDSDGYASVTENNYNVSFNYEATLYSYNSVRIYAFDSDSGDVIENFNISLLSGTTYYENSSADNYTYFPTILEGEYVVRFTAINYSVSNYIITMYDNSFQVLNIYANPNATSENVIFNVYDAGSNAVLENVLITQRKILLGSYVSIESKLSDISGRAQFTYYENIPYYFIASKDGYITREFSLTPLFDSYDVRMYPSVSSNDSIYTDDVVINVEDYLFTNSTSYILASFFSPLGSLETYSVNVTLDNGTSYISSGTNAVGSYINVSFVNGAVSFGDSAFVTFTYKSTLNAGEKKISRVFLFSTWDNIEGGLESLKDSIAGYSDFEKIFWLSLITIALASLFSVFGFASGEYFVFACIGGLIGIVAGGILGLVNWVAGGLTIFLLLLFIVGRVINSG